MGGGLDMESGEVERSGGVSGGVGIVTDGVVIGCGGCGKEVGLCR